MTTNDLKPLYIAKIVDPFGAKKPTDTIYLRVDVLTKRRIESRAEGLGLKRPADYLQRLIVRDLLKAEGDFTDKELDKIGLSLKSVPKKGRSPF